MTKLIVAFRNYANAPKKGRMFRIKVKKSEDCLLILYESISNQTTIHSNSGLLFYTGVSKDKD
jgi:hypothetical protein